MSDNTCDGCVFYEDDASGTGRCNLYDCKTDCDTEACGEYDEDGDGDLP